MIFLYVVAGILLFLLLTVVAIRLYVNSGYRRRKIKEAKGEYEYGEIPLNEDPRSPFYGWKIEELPTKIYFDWEEVFNCKMRSKKKTACDCLSKRKLKLDKIGNGKHVQVNFISPPWTWKDLVGRSGVLTICLVSKKQVRFRLQVMN